MWVPRLDIQAESMAYRHYNQVLNQNSSIKEMSEQMKYIISPITVMNTAVRYKVTDQEIQFTIMTGNPLTPIVTRLYRGVNYSRACKFILRAIVSRSLESTPDQFM
jgi:hypothetical protein